MSACRLPAEDMMNYGKKTSSGQYSALLLVVTLTHTIYLKIAANQVYCNNTPSSLFYRDNTPSHVA